MQETIAQAKAELFQTNKALQKALATTPDDRINWSPSSTARTPIQQVAHCAIAITGIQIMLQEQPRLVGEFGKEAADPNTENAALNGPIAYPFANVAEMDIAFRKAEHEYNTRAQVLTLLEETTSEFTRWLDTLTPEKFGSTIQAYFGPMPVAFGITVPALHTRVHIAQIEYIQTIYGDMERH